ncbi:hypothetical protein VPH35_006501 [Triticum aestivum]|uniref:uncharacterized protein n=1 Tax=Triticum aestivum TaxID=4565 RepID=UPI001D002B57|nr:uncharacterized protein LOC123086724 [Triticum aestivum]
MGNSKSKAVEPQPEEDVTMGLSSMKNVEDNNARIIPVAQSDDETNAIVLEGTCPVGEHNEALLSALSTLTVDCCTDEYEGSRSLRDGNHRDATLLASSNLTLDSGSIGDITLKAVGCEPSNNEIDGATKLKGNPNIHTDVFGSGSNIHQLLFLLYGLCSYYF